MEADRLEEPFQLCFPFDVNKELRVNTSQSVSSSQHDSHVSSWLQPLYAIYT